MGRYGRAAMSGDLRHIPCKSMEVPRVRQSLITNFRKVCEATAIRAAAWNGRADQVSANADAMTAVRRGLGAMSMSGHVVLGQRERIEGSEPGSVHDILRRGEVVGRGGDSLDIAVDPI